MNNKINPQKLCLMAMAIVINFVGGKLALALGLPIYLDTIGTIFTGAVLGPIYGILPAVAYSLIGAVTGDVFALYYMPVGILAGVMAGLACRKKMPSKGWVLLSALIITVPGTILSSLITAKLFGGITSSSNTIIIQMLSKTPIGLTGACFIVQVCTDYIDRVISLIVTVLVYKALPADLKDKLRSR